MRFEFFVAKNNQLPETFSTLSNLKYLNFHDNPYLPMPDVCGFAQLKGLILRGNTNLGDSFVLLLMPLIFFCALFFMEILVMLLLSNKTRFTVPDCIVELSLEVLEISITAVETFPIEIYTMPTLRFLDTSFMRNVMFFFYFSLFFLVVFFDT